MLTSWHLNERAERSVSKEGQLTKDTTVKWPIVLSHVERKAYFTTCATTTVRNIRRI